MTFKRALCGGTALLLAGCTAAALSQGQMAVNDAEAVVNALEATHTLPTPAATIASLVIVGLQGLLNSSNASLAANATPETTATNALANALTSLKTATTNPTIQSEAQTALDALTALQASSGQSAQNQALALSATVLVDYLKTQVPANAATTGSTSQVPALIADAEAHIARLRAR